MKGSRRCKRSVGLDAQHHRDATLNPDTRESRRGRSGGEIKKTSRKQNGCSRFRVEGNDYMQTGR